MLPQPCLQQPTSCCKPMLSLMFSALRAQARRFGKPGGVRACAAFGGLSKHDQFKELKAGCEVRVTCCRVAAGVMGHAVPGSQHSGPLFCKGHQQHGIPQSLLLCAGVSGTLFATTEQNIEPG